MKGPTLRPLLCLTLIGVLLGGCTSVETRDPVPFPLVEAAQPVGFDTPVRMWGDRNDPAEIERRMVQRAKQLIELYGEDAKAGTVPEFNFLAISGGGQYGAFTAGVLNAWSETGERPVFDGVSGISTGSIIAPFAFLGEKYDYVLEEVYTTTTTADMLEPTVLSGILSGSALADTSGLRNKIAEYITPELLAEIAVEHRKGRSLFVGTTNIDVGRPVIWNMGSIADSGKPEALQLFRDIILASAAIPMAFPPVFFDVEAGGETYREMHVDGGVTSQVSFISPQVPNYLMDQLVGFEVRRNGYVLVNGAITPPPEVVEARTHKIAGASMNTLWYAQAVGDLYRIHAIAERDEADVSYGWIPSSFTEEPTEEFDPVFMKKLFALGQTLVHGGELWKNVPPNFTARGTTKIERGLRPMPSLSN